MKPAFSAVELLLVAGISAILVAIAVPGYMEAKLKAEVADVHASMRSIHDGLLTYKIDYSQFPPPRMAPGSRHPLQKIYNMGYLSKEPIDRFKEKLEGYGGRYTDPYIGYGFMDPNDRLFIKMYARMQANSIPIPTNGTSHGPWYLKSIGPDQTDHYDEGGGRGSNKANEYFVEYDPSNGVFSLGEIISDQTRAFLQ